MPAPRGGSTWWFHAHHDDGVIDDHNNDDMWRPGNHTVRREHTSTRAARGETSVFAWGACSDREYWFATVFEIGCLRMCNILMLLISSPNECSECTIYISVQMFTHVHLVFMLDYVCSNGAPTFRTRSKRVRSTSHNNAMYEINEL